MTNLQSKISTKIHFFGDFTSSGNLKDLSLNSLDKIDRRNLSRRSSSIENGAASRIVCALAPFWWRSPFSTDEKLRTKRTFKVYKSVSACYYLMPFKQNNWFRHVIVMQIITVSLTFLKMIRFRNFERFKTINTVFLVQLNWKQSIDVGFWEQFLKNTLKSLLSTKLKPEKWKKMLHILKLSTNIPSTLPSDLCANISQLEKPS